MVVLEKFRSSLVSSDSSWCFGITSPVEDLVIFCPFDLKTCFVRTFIEFQEEMSELGGGGGAGGQKVAKAKTKIFKKLESPVSIRIVCEQRDRMVFYFWVKFLATFRFSHHSRAEISLVRKIKLSVWLIWFRWSISTTVTCNQTVSASVLSYQQTLHQNRCFVTR